MPFAHAVTEQTETADNTTEAAHRLFEQAEMRFAQGQYEAALSLFRQAMAVEPHDALLFNMAVCLQELGRLREAKATYEAAASSPQLDDDARLRARMAAQRLSIDVAPKPSPTSSALQPPPSETWVRSSTFGPLGWAGIAFMGSGAVAATALWIAAGTNENRYEAAISRNDISAARRYANRGDTFDVWYKVSLTVGLLGATVSLVDALWLQPHNRRVRVAPGGLSLQF